MPTSVKSPPHPSNLPSASKSPSPADPIVLDDSSNSSGSVPPSPSSHGDTSDEEWVAGPPLSSSLAKASSLALAIKTTRPLPSSNVPVARARPAAPKPPCPPQKPPPPSLSKPPPLPLTQGVVSSLPTFSESLNALRDIHKAGCCWASGPILVKVATSLSEDTEKTIDLTSTLGHDKCAPIYCNDSSGGY